MSKEHTPEPWEISHETPEGYFALSNEHLSIGDIWRKEDAERIVECVNSCAAIKHPEKIYRCLTRVQEILSAALTNQNHIDTDCQLELAIGLIEETLGENED
jgi:hypothetical protein